jgi:peptide deformylase
MAETMYAEDGVGLAAPQVGECIRLFLADPAPAEEHGKRLLVFINPEIVARSGKQVWDEGCLSVPGMRAEVQSSAKVTVRALDRDFQPFEITGEGLAAVCFQHEIDHLDGKLFFDRLSPLKKKLFLHEYEKRRAAVAAEAQTRARGA